MRIVYVLALTLLCACAVGPDYVRPAVETPLAYKETKDWKIAAPKEDAPRGSWWAVYKDPVLDDLESKVAVSNQNLRAAEAAYRQAHALAEEANAALFPTVTATPSATRSGDAGTGVAKNTFHVNAAANWELDVWGRIRRTVEASEANAAASAADLAAAKLSAEAELAGDYFQLRTQDELKRLLDETVENYKETLKITHNQYKSGVVAETDVASAETQLETTRAQAINVGVARAQLEHAIAVLIGKAPSEFSIAPAPLNTMAVVTPAGVPSTLLERRPDIAAVERRMMAANAQIGVAVAAYYPAVTLSASAGLASSTLDNLLKTSSGVWSFGPGLAETLFDAGARQSAVEAARAAYDESVANYRQTVLAAFAGVEDQLATLRILEQQAAVQEKAVKAAQKAERLVLNQYKSGIVPYSSVIVAENLALANEQTALTLRQNRLNASVQLIKALGGGYSEDRGQGSDVR